LPSQIAQLAASPRVYCSLVTASLRKILVVDDQPMLATAIRRMLSGLLG